MRAAVFSDIHGNIEALDAVLAAAHDEGVDEYWCRGDLVAHGPRPAEVVARLRELGGPISVRGNTDRYVLTGDVGGMIPPIDRPQSPSEFAILADARESFAWTRGCLVGTHQLDWLAGLPLEQRVTLPDGTRVLLVHAGPGRDDGLGMHPDRSDEALAAAGFGVSAADLILVGHTHVPGERFVAGGHVANPGPVSLPRTADDLARWILIDASASGYRLTFREVRYDLDRVIEDLDRQRHPSGPWLAVKMTRTQ
jgi:predicted phosphodiesterase